MGWLILALMGAVTFLYGLSVHAALLCLLVKPLPVLALLGWLHDAPPTEYRRWISLGLIFSLLGDVLLAWPGDLFVFGLGAFLVAHLAYLKAYLSDCRRLALLPLVIALGVGALLLGILILNGLGPLLVPVIVYAMAISAMLWRALARLGTDVPQRSGVRLLRQRDRHQPLRLAVPRRAVRHHPQLLVGPVGHRRLGILEKTATRYRRHWLKQQPS